MLLAHIFDAAVGTHYHAVIAHLLQGYCKPLVASRRARRESPCGDGTAPSEQTRCAFQSKAGGIPSSSTLGVIAHDQTMIYGGSSGGAGP